MPPYAPAQVQLQGPEPETAEAEPALQKFEVGTEYKFPPLLAPHTPFTAKLAEQDADVPLFEPLQDQFQGPVPDTEETEPEVHRFEDGAEYRFDPLDGPQTPLTLSNAEQDALVPPLAPAQDQDHGPEPDTEDAPPTEQRPDDGAEYRFVPLLAPQTPFTFNKVEQLAVVPP